MRGEAGRSGMRLGKGRRVGFYFPHGFAVIYLFAAIQAFMEFKRRHFVSLAVKLAGQISPNFFNPVTTARWASCNFHVGALALKVISWMKPENSRSPRLLV